MAELKIVFDMGDGHADHLIYETYVVAPIVRYGAKRLFCIFSILQVVYNHWVKTAQLLIPVIA